MVLLVWRKKYKQKTELPSAGEKKRKKKTMKTRSYVARLVPPSHWTMLWVNTSMRTLIVLVVALRDLVHREEWNKLMQSSAWTMAFADPKTQTCALHLTHFARRCQSLPTRLRDECAKLEKLCPDFRWLPITVSRHDQWSKSFLRRLISLFVESAFVFRVLVRRNNDYLFEPMRKRMADTLPKLAPDWDYCVSSADTIYEHVRMAHTTRTVFVARYGRNPKHPHVQVGLLLHGPMWQQLPSCAHRGWTATDVNTLRRRTRRNGQDMVRIIAQYYNSPMYLDNVHNAKICIATDYEWDKRTRTLLASQRDLMDNLRTMCETYTSLQHVEWPDLDVNEVDWSELGVPSSSPPSNDPVRVTVNSNYLALEAPDSPAHWLQSSVVHTFIVPWPTVGSRKPYGFGGDFPRHPRHASTIPGGED